MIGITLTETNQPMIKPIGRIQSEIYIQDDDSGVSTNEDFVTVTAGTEHTCGITQSGVLKCWGANSDGQFGDGTTTWRSSPVVIDTGINYGQIKAGYYHTCGITTAGIFKCWGLNGSGRLGDGTTTQRSSPVVIDPGVTYSQSSAGGEHTCNIIKNDNFLKCWGQDSFNQLGIGARNNFLPWPIVP